MKTDSNNHQHWRPIGEPKSLLVIRTGAWASSHLQKQGPFTSNWQCWKAHPNMDHNTQKLQALSSTWVSNRQKALPVRELHMNDRQEAQPVRDGSGTHLRAWPQQSVPGNLAGFVLYPAGWSRGALGILCVLASPDKKSVYFLNLVSLPSFFLQDRKINTVTQQY